MYISKSKQPILAVLATMIDTYPDVQDRRGGTSTNYNAKRFKWFETFTTDFMLEVKDMLPKEYFYVTVTSMHNSYARYLAQRIGRPVTEKCPDPEISYNGALCITWQNWLNDLCPSYFTEVMDLVIHIKANADRNWLIHQKLKELWAKAFKQIEEDKINGTISYSRTSC